MVDQDWDVILIGAGQSGTWWVDTGATFDPNRTVPMKWCCHVLAYNLTRVMNIMGVQPLLAAVRA